MSAIGLESIDRPLGHLEIEIRGCMTQLHIDTDYKHLQLGDIRSQHQLRSVIVK